jgi:Uma2 family endonuclease
MATVVEIEEGAETFADLLGRIGDVPLNRILAKPAPGTATERDVIAAWEAPRKRLCELVDGVLVEKPMGTPESLLACFIIHWILDHLEKEDLGVVLGEGGPVRLMRGLVRMPDVSFISRDKLPNGELPDEPIADFAPDLAIEVLSKSNTKAEMKRKLRDFFQHGVRLAWLIDPRKQTAEAYTSPEDFLAIGKNQSLDAGDVLPGFRLSLKKLFAAPKRRKR